MAVTKNKQVHDSTAQSKAVVTMQSALGLTPNTLVDKQHLAGKIIDCENRLNTLYPGSIQVHKTIDDQQIPAAIMAIQNLIP